MYFFFKIVLGVRAYNNIFSLQGIHKLKWKRKTATAVRL